MQRLRPRSSMLGCIAILILSLSSISPFPQSAPVAQAAGTITGTVFRDFNANGSKEATETIGVAGVTVTAYDSSNSSRGTATTAANGTYAFGATGTGPYRIEFTTLPSGYFPSAQGNDSGSTVQFVPDGNSSNINLGINDPADYCQSNPELCTNVYAPGAQAGNERVLARMPYFSTGDIQATATSRGSANQVGTTWGLAYQPSTQALFSAAFMKRHAGFGPGGTGQIYRTDAAGVVTPFAVIPNTGTDPHPTAQPPDGLGLCHSAAGPDYSPLGIIGAIGCYFHDPYSFDKVGKIGLGDMDIAIDPVNSANDGLFVVNLNDRQLYRVSNLAGIHTVSAGAMPLALPGAIQGCALADVRPFGLTFWRGVGYAGLVCSAETTQNAAQLRAYIYSFDPSTMVFGSAPLGEFPLTYTRGFADDPVNANWHPWISSFASVPPSQKTNNESAYAQPILSDLVFDNAGNLTIGLRDRFGDQMGNLSGSTDPNDQNTYLGISAGDTLKVCLQAGAYQLESNGVCGGSTSVGNPGGFGPDSIQSQPQGPGGNEFYAADAHMDAGGFLVLFHEETSLGGLAYMAELNEVATTVFDPIDGGATHTGGVRRFQAANGSQAGVFQLYAGQFPDYFGKAAGMGDLELLCDSAPIEIGNRVWFDTNHNGIQDAGELPIANVVLGLYNSAGTLIDTVTTDSNGTYVFSSATGTDVPGRNYGVNIQPNTTYTVGVLSSNTTAGGALAGLAPTTANSGGNTTNQDINGATPDTTDSDGVTVAVGSGANAATNGQTFTTGAAGANNHTFDFGFFPSLSIGNLVWEDVDNDGLKDAGESGIDKVTVNLYQDTDHSGTLSAGDSLIASQNTSNGGHYLFDGLAPDTYFVQIDSSNFQPGGPLIGYGSTTGTNGSPTGPYEPGQNGTVDSDDNGTTGTGGLATAGVTGGIVSGPITLVVGTQPTTETDLGMPTGVTNSATNPNSNLTIDFGVFRPASLGSTVWNDTNKDGVKQPAEPGVAGVAVTLYDGNGNPIATTVTDSTGHYQFIDLVPGTYSVGFGALPPGYTFTPQNQGSSDTDDSDANPSTGMTSSITLVPGENNPTVYAGIVPNPTAIALASFTATHDGNRVLVRWATTAEINTWGFQLYRSADGTRANATRVTAQLIPGQGRGQGGARYSWTDASTVAGVTYTYWLVETEIGGATHEYGPATIGAGPAALTYHVFMPLAGR